MTKQKLIRKFSNDVNILADAIDGVINLECDHPQLYKKLYEFYDVNGIQLYGDSDDNYEVIMAQLTKDLTF
jgi:hypothetical protein